MSDWRPRWEALDPDAPPRFAWLRDPGARRVAVLLGAFDPPTAAHLAVATGAARLTGRTPVLCLTRVLLDRTDPALLELDERAELLVALGEAEGLGVAACNRGTYLAVARAAWDAGLDAAFVVGADKLVQLSDPSFYPDGEDGARATFREVPFVVVPRGTARVPEGVEQLDPQEVFGDPGLALLSATEVRRRVRAGEDVTDLVPSVVAERLRGYTEASDGA